MAYLDEGPRDAPIILMLHGNPSWSYLYRNLILHLKDSFRCIAPDHLGCGNSNKPQDYPYHFENHVHNIKQLVSHLNLTSFSLVVHDWGGAIGAALSCAHPEKITSFTAMNTAAFLSKRLPARINICRTPLIGEVLVRHFNAFAAGATYMAVATKMERDVANDFTYPYHDWKSRIATHRFVTDIPRSPLDYSYNYMKQVDHDFAQLKMPLQIIWGGKDFCFDDSFYDTWRQRFPQAPHHYFNDAGHYLLEDRGHTIYPLIHDFIRDI